MLYSMKNTKQEMLEGLSEVSTLKEQQTILFWLLFLVAGLGFMF